MSTTTPTVEHDIADPMRTLIDLQTLLKSNERLNNAIVADFTGTVDAATDCWTSLLEKSNNIFETRIASLETRLSLSLDRLLQTGALAGLCWHWLDPL